MRILIVDDSVVFRSQIRASLEGTPDIEIAGVANNGKVALQKLAQGSVDVVTLDMEMPEMNGIETIKEIRKLKYPVRVIFFSAHTTRGSEAALDALAAGADDFVAKPSGPDVTFETAGIAIKQQLLPKILQFLDSRQKSRVAKSVAANQTVKTPPTWAKRDLETFLPQVIVLGSSTGGPPALEKVLSLLVKTTRIPILIAQHMPPVFTASLARRIQEGIQVETAEGKHGEVVKPNRIYIAPGDFHMTVKKIASDVVIQLDQGPQRNSVRPAVDNLFESAVSIYANRTLGVILTGMGEDGMLGCRSIKNAGGGVAIQDKASCVVFGMPGAVHAQGLHDQEMNLNQISELIKRVTN